MTDEPLSRFWAGGTYRGADLLGEWVTNIGYVACHAEQRDWLACEWYERTGADERLPPHLVLAWDARCDDLEWIQLAVPDIHPLVKPFERLGVHRHGASLVPAPQVLDGTPGGARGCGRHGTTENPVWAVLPLDLPTMSPQTVQAAVLRVAKTWQELRPVAPEDDPWQRVRAFEDFPDLPGWVHDVATANAERRVDVFRGTGGVYWTFNEHGEPGPKVRHGLGRPVPEAHAFATWAESTELPDHAAYERPAPHRGVFRGTYGWASFYFSSPTLDTAGTERDAAMRHAMGLLHLAGKNAPRHHRDGERWRRPLTVVADRSTDLAQVRYRGPQDSLYVADETASAWFRDVLLGRPQAEDHLLRRVEELVQQWRVHS